MFAHYLLDVPENSYTSVVMDASSATVADVGVIPLPRVIVEELHSYPCCDPLSSMTALMGGWAVPPLGVVELSLLRLIILMWTLTLALCFATQAHMCLLVMVDGNNVVSFVLLVQSRLIVTLSRHR